MCSIGRYCPTITRADGTPAIKARSNNKNRAEHGMKQVRHAERLNQSIASDARGKTPSRDGSIGRLSVSASFGSLGNSHSMYSSRSSLSRPEASLVPAASPYRKFKGRACSATIETHAKIGLWSSFSTGSTSWQIAPQVNEHQ